MPEFIARRLRKSDGIETSFRVVADDEVSARSMLDSDLFDLVSLVQVLPQRRQVGHSLRWVKAVGLACIGIGVGLLPLAITFHDGPFKWSDPSISALRNQAFLVATGLALSTIGSVIFVLAECTSVLLQAIIRDS